MQGKDDPVTFTIAYSASLTLLPIPNTLRTWEADKAALKAVFTAFNHPMPSLDAPPTSSEQLAQTVGTAQPPAFAAKHLGRSRKLPHCSVPGVLCNAEGRITHFDGIAAGLAAQNGNSSTSAAAAVGSTLQMPWIVVASFQGLDLFGTLPRFADSGHPLRHVCILLHPALHCLDAHCVVRAKATTPPCCLCVYRNLGC